MSLLIACVLVVPLAFAEDIQQKHNKKDWNVPEDILERFQYQVQVLLVSGLSVLRTIGPFVLYCGIGIRTAR